MKWEYATHFIKDTGHFLKPCGISDEGKPIYNWDDEWDWRSLNELGEEGWEMIGFNFTLSAFGENRGYAIFKRPKPT